MKSTESQKLLSIVAHGSIFLSSLVVSIGIPIAVLFISDDWVVKDNAREAINFHINLFLYAALGGLLFITVIGIPIAFVLWAVLAVISWLMPIVAIVRVLEHPNQPYRYPFILRLL
ncbi:MAG TPA: DUF4870 domain-containing protein [Leptolyngbya sp.]|jgi:uncharacterized Tic20 family protein|nr:DUF4870 domain-containing protein [Leptolyngbya sp.]